MQSTGVVQHGWMSWREAMQQALYGLDEQQGIRGFYRQAAGPAAHFRTSVHASPLLATAFLRLIERLDALLGSPQRFDVVDVGAGRGELLLHIAEQAEPPLRARLALTAVEQAERPHGLPEWINWRDDIPPTAGIIIANEWLDNVPFDIAEIDHIGQIHLIEVAPQGTAQRLGPIATPEQAHWLERWWPLSQPGERAEIGVTRDAAWRTAVQRLERGLALCIDYTHLRQARPLGGTLAAYAHGVQVEPVTDGSCDLTAHVAVDAVSEAGRRGGADETVLATQRDALHALGLAAVRPPRELASTNPAEYLHALSRASELAELTDRNGLGGFSWLCQSKGLPPDWLITHLR